MSLPYYSHTAPVRESDLVKREFDPEFCRGQYTLLAGDGAERSVVLGTILADVLADAAIAVTAAAVAGNTGDGTLTLADPEYTSAVKEGVYRVTCTVGGADGTSKFNVEGPNGKSVGVATGGAAFAKQVKFTIAGGGANFAVGDAFEVNVAIDNENAAIKSVAWVPGAADDTGAIAGIAVRPTTAPDGEDREGLRIERGPAILAIDTVQWPDGIAAKDKAAAIESFKAMNILLR